MSTEESQPAPSRAPSPAASPAPAPTQVPSPLPPAAHTSPPARRRVRIVIGVIVAAAILIFGIPRVIHAFHTVSTDDAYVNSYVTFVAPRVEGQVARVLVDDNNRVKKGDVLVELDPEPYRIQVAIKQAAVDSAQANLVTTRATAESQAGQLRGLRFQLDHAIEEVDNQVALLRSRVATLDATQASLVYAKAEFGRAKNLLATKVISNEEYDLKREAIDTANAQVSQALESVAQARVGLGLPREPPPGEPLTDVPPDIDQTYSAVRVAVGNLLQGAAQLGLFFSDPFNLTPKEIYARFFSLDPSKDVNRIYAQLLKNAPAVKQAETAVVVAQRDLDQANLNLRYCTIVAEIDGVVTRRNVNPGNYVQIGESLMAIRSLRDIWVDANFKETQLRDLRIGQHVDLDVDMYGGKRRFEGRISGFTEGTGSTLALLPAQNATGNFVKVVQRLPVRVDLVNYDPDKLPLFVGLSVTPTVDLESTPAGPNAGKYLQEAIDSTPPPTSNAQ
jgi:membrane fusion protein (multidrug efflux system)